jgi:hypothetical protein
VAIVRLGGRSFLVDPAIPTIFYGDQHASGRSSARGF